MKKLFTLLALLTLLPIAAFADVVEIDGIYYNLVTKGNIAEVALKTGSPYSGDVVIPEYVTYNDVRYHVTVIGEYAFDGSYNISSLTLPSSISIIRERAFYECVISSIKLTDIAVWFNLPIDEDCNLHL